jgi:hypothetical protein
MAEWDNRRLRIEFTLGCKKLLVGGFPPRPARKRPSLFSSLVLCALCVSQP